jgi:hypothetical protein
MRITTVILLMVLVISFPAKAEDTDLIIVDLAAPLKAA